MLGFFKRNKPSVADALVNQTIGGQSVLYRLFLEAVGCEDSSIRRLELTYLAASVMTYVYLRIGKQSNRDEILDGFAKKILLKSIPSSRESISFNEAVSQYQRRFAEYTSMMNLLFSPGESSSSNPAAILLMHAFECITNSSARSHMIQIIAASGLIQQFIADHIDFVKEKL
jgi:hypothetical protein